MPGKFCALEVGCREIPKMQFYASAKLLDLESVLEASRAYDVGSLA